MRRSTLNFLVDTAALLGILVLVATGLMIRFVLPPGTGGRHDGHGLQLWGMGRHDWGDVHFWTSIVVIALLLIHVVLHWSWVCTTLGGLCGVEGAARSGKRNVYGVGCLAILIFLFGGFIWYANSVVQEVNLPEEIPSNVRHSGLTVPKHGEDEPHSAAHDLVRGSMTLMQVEIATGVSVATLKRELRLPEDVSADDHLGQLGRRYGFDMEKVREVVAKHMRQDGEK